jgi:hypothetical protein
MAHIPPTASTTGLPAPVMASGSPVAGVRCASCFLLDALRVGRQVLDGVEE